MPCRHPKNLILLAFLALPVMAQAPPPSPAEQELQQPLDLADGKPTQTQAPPPAPSGARALLSTLLVAGLAGGGLWAFRKYGVRKLPGAGGSRLKVEESLALGDRRFVSILRADEERFLLALTPQGIQLLGRLDGPEAAPGGGFAEALDRQVDMTRPMPVKDMEALLKGNPS